MTADLTDNDARTDWGPQRSKTITWHEPGPSTAKGLTMAGLDYLQAIAEGRLPQAPISGLMEFAIAEAHEGRVVFTCQPDESAYNPIGAIHGGLICTLLDSVTGCAVHSTLPAARATPRSRSRSTTSRRYA
jgi:acyl-coenzyme A thioesterase PaaI-like protein